MFPVHYVYAEEANQGSNVLVRISSSLHIRTASDCLVNLHPYAMPVTQRKDSMYSILH